MPSSTQAQRGSGRPHTPAAAKAASAGDPVRPGVSEQLETADRFYDRDLQDKVIRYLTDAKLRSGEANKGLLNEDEAERAKRFSHFLARRYYRDRLHRGFRYSAGLISPAQAPEHVVETPAFDSILESCILGSLATSRELGRLSASQLLPLRQEEWWSELLQYELAFFIQLATSEAALPSAVPKRNPSAILRRFQFRIPELLKCLKAGENAIDDLRGEVTLLFSRTNHGRIYVVETDETSTAVFPLINGDNTAEEIAASCAISADETRRILSTFNDIGTVVLPAP
jgi:hypothetical protein